MIPFAVPAHADSSTIDELLALNPGTSEQMLLPPIRIRSCNWPGNFPDDRIRIIGTIS
jgi:hypothetical protein